MNDDNRIRLRVLGLSYEQLKNSAYMLILSQVDGSRHISMWIGEAEAHSIAIAMEGLRPPRPLVHDLFVSLAHTFGIKLKEVFIYRVDDEIYSSELTFSDGERIVKIDSRTSDGIAIAMRSGAPIYTTREIMEEKGFHLDISRPGVDTSADDNEESDDTIPSDRDTGYNNEPRVENYTVEELQKLLDRLIADENYEEAGRINEILQRKKNDGK